MPKKKKEPYDATIRFRAFSDLEKRIERIVNARGYGDAADFLREGTALRVMEEEKRLGLPPLPAHPKVSYSVKLARKKKRQAARQKKSAA